MTSDTIPAPQWPIIVISLASDMDRRTELGQTIARMGLNCSFLEAIDGREGLSAQDNALIDRAAARSMTRPLSDGEFACALSHRKAYQHIVEHGLSGAIILEDDAILGPDFATFMTQQAYLAAPMILLYHSFARIRRGAIRDFGQFGALGRIANRPRGAVAYSLSQSVAQRLLVATTPVRCDADWPCDLFPLDAWGICPRLVDHPEQTEAQSRLETERKRMRNLPWRKPVRRFLTAEYWRTRMSVRFCR